MVFFHGFLEAEEEPGLAKPEHFKKLQILLLTQVALKSRTAGICCFTA